jgi:UDP-glucose 4-epimerase
MSGKIAVVTGGAGFIGSHVVERLLNDGHRVRVVDNYSTGRPENVAMFAPHPNFEMIEGDIADPAVAMRAISGAQWVFHFAALADIVPSIQKPLDYHHANVDGTVSALAAASEAGVEKFLYAASSTCYGIPDVYPTPETAPIRPMYPYALTKNVGEQYALHWARVYRLPAIALRMFNVYGPRSRTSGTYGAVFGVFLAQRLASEPYTVVGDGTQTRDFTFVTDIADAFVTAAGSDIVGETFNVGSGNTYSVNRLVELLGGPVVYVPKRPGEPDCTFADTAKIERMLGWKAKVPLEQGVAIMLDNIDYWRQAPVWRPDSIAQATKEWFECLT